MDILDIHAAAQSIRHEIRDALEASPLPAIGSAPASPTDKTILVKTDGSASIWSDAAHAWLPLSFPVFVNASEPSSPPEKMVWVRTDGSSAIRISGAWVELSPRLFLGSDPGAQPERSLWQDVTGALYVRNGGAWVRTTPAPDITVALSPPTSTTHPWFDPSVLALSYWNATAGAWIRQHVGAPGAPINAFLSTSGAYFRNTAGDYYLTA